MKLEMGFVEKGEVDLHKSQGIDTIGEYPSYNTCDHTLIDMSKLRVEDKDDWMHTLSVKLPNGNFVTLCVMQCADEQSCIDGKFYGDNIKGHRVLGFKNGKTQVIEEQGTYALVLDAKGVK